MPTRYNPPVKVGQREITYQSLVNRADPDNPRRKVRDEEYAGWYDGSRGRTFYANPTKRGAYADD